MPAAITMNSLWGCNYPKEKAPRRALLFDADYDLVAIATHDPEEGQEVGEDVVHV